MRRASSRLSFVATVYNEEKTIYGLLVSLFRQSKKPDEIIIVDGGSTDNTLSVMSNFKYPISNVKLKLKIVKKRGNRSVGRNEGIKHARGDIILLSDAGCTLDRNWVKNISEPFRDVKVDVVAGYYKARPKTIFQKCLLPYVFVMPDKLNKDTFLPASRSMAFRKSVWERVGGFSEQFSHNEDYVFAKNLKQKKINIFFAQRAIVYWQPRSTIRQAFVMFFRFAFGDAEANVYRPKVVLILLRYFFAAVFVLIIWLSASRELIYLFLFLCAAYVFWAILKNYRYVRSIRALYIFPLLQITSDIAVISGTSFGFLKSIWGKQK